MISRAQPGGIERDALVLKTVLREHDGFLGVGALVVSSGQLAVGDAVVELGGAAEGGPANLVMPAGEVPSPPT